MSILQRANLCFDLGEILFHSYERWKGEKNHSKYVNIYIIMHTHMIFPSKLIIDLSWKKNFHISEKLIQYRNRKILPIYSCIDMTSGKEGLYTSLRTLVLLPSIPLGPALACRCFTCIQVSSSALLHYTKYQQNTSHTYTCIIALL